VAVGTTRILNVGAGSSTKFEDLLAEHERSFTADRVDLDPYAVNRPYVGQTWVCSVEEMQPVPSSHCDVVFANYLFEHVRRLDGAAAEIHRVLVPGGLFVTTIPNPRAPEFIVSRHTPHAFHEWVRGGRAWETEYAYASLAELARHFIDAGFVGQELHRSSYISVYTRRFPVLRRLGRAYDRVLTARRWTFLMGQACLVVTRPSGKLTRPTSTSRDGTDFAT
jgi:SAM-dependent methyltransferase